MRTTAPVIETETEDTNVYLSSVPQKDSEDWDGEIVELDEKHVLELAKKFKVSPALVYMIVDSVHSLSDNVVTDLQSIWKRLDAIEGK